jgi:hypothetical protein
MSDQNQTFFKILTHLPGQDGMMEEFNLTLLSLSSYYYADHSVDCLK